MATMEELTHPFTQTAPRPNTRASYAVNLMNRGLHYRDAARQSGMKEQSAEKLFFRYVLYAELLKLRKEVADLKAGRIA